jgi:hypothetical protein
MNIRSGVHLNVSENRLFMLCGVNLEEGPYGIADGSPGRHSSFCTDY